MTGILAIETSTDVCSVAVAVGGEMRELRELAPRQHNQLLFEMLQELLPGGDLRSAGIEAIAYGCGPGSFTGLRIAASAVQGLAFSTGLPAVSVSTLAIMAQTALREHEVCADLDMVCVLDARLNEIYSATYCSQNGVAVESIAASVVAPNQLRVSGSNALALLGGGAKFVDDFPAPLRQRVAFTDATMAPAAQDLVLLAQMQFQRGEVQTAAEAQPVYVRNEVSWKKLSEQGVAK